MTNTTKLVAPLWGAERMSEQTLSQSLFPDKEPPIIIDLATCAAAYGKSCSKQNSQGDVPEWDY